MARLPYPSRDALPVELTDMLNKLPRNNITEMLAQAHTLTEPFFRIGGATLTALELSDRNRELVILAVCGLAECEYMYIQRAPMVESVGIDAELRERVWRGDFEAPDDSGERALLAFVAAVVRAPRVSDEIFAATLAHFNARQIVEVLQLVGYYWTISRLCTVLELEFDYPDGLKSQNAFANLDT